MQAIVLILFLVLLIALGPLLTIWSLNTLFPVLAIPYAFDTWFATLWIGGVFAARIKSK